MRRTASGRSRDSGSARATARTATPLSSATTPGLDVAPRALAALRVPGGHLAGHPVGHDLHSADFDLDDARFARAQANHVMRVAGRDEDPLTGRGELLEADRSWRVGLRL